MTRTIYVIRHGKAGGNRYNRDLYGKKGSALTEEGIAESRLLGAKLAELGIDVAKRPAAVSELIRTFQTADYAGFNYVTINPLLNEVNSGLPPEILEGMLERKEVPEAALMAARMLLNNPPRENIWVTHGLVIAGLGQALDIPKNELFIPDTGSLTQIVLPSKQ